MNRHDLIAELRAIATNDTHPLAKDNDVATAAHSAARSIDARIAGHADLPGRDPGDEDDE